jgi:hypothetical protein
MPSSNCCSAIAVRSPKRKPCRALQDSVVPPDADIGGGTRIERKGLDRHAPHVDGAGPASDNAVSCRAW